MISLLPLLAAAAAYTMGLPLVATLVAAAFVQSLLAYGLTKHTLFLRMAIGSAIVGTVALTVPAILSRYAAAGDVGTLPNFWNAINWIAGISSVVTILVSFVGAWGEGNPRDDDYRPRRSSGSTSPRSGVFRASAAAKGLWTQASPRQLAFEQRLREHIRKKGSAVKMDLSKDLNGQYSNSATRAAYAKYDAAPEHARSTDDFMTSMLVGYLTHSAPLGYLAGGSLAGALVGSAFGSDDQPRRHEPSASPTGSLWETTPEPSAPSVRPSYSYGSDSDTCRASDYSSNSSSWSSDSSSSSSSDSGSSGSFD